MIQVVNISNLVDVRAAPRLESAAMADGALKFRAPSDR